MKQALGLVEMIGLSNAIVVADAMAKAANVEIIDVENTKGQGYMTIKVIGDVGAVNAAVNVGKQMGIECGKLVSFKVIPRPTDYIEKAFCKQLDLTSNGMNPVQSKDKNVGTQEKVSEKAFSEIKEEKAEKIKIEEPKTETINENELEEVLVQTELVEDVKPKATPKKRKK